MPVLSADASNITQKCSNCGNENAIAVNTLTLGHALDKNVIILPDCPGCGAKENLSRTWDTIPAKYQGTPFDKQRRAVNALGQKLRADAQIHANHVAEVNAEGSVPPDMDNGGAWPPVPVPIPIPKNPGGNPGPPES